MLPPVRYLYRSVTENDRLSPRLATVFAFVAAALALLWHGATTPAKVEGGIIITAWPPEYIWSGLCLIIAGLLGLGKVVDAFTKVKLEGPPPGPDTQVIADTAPVTSETTTITTLPDAPASPQTGTPPS